MFLFRKLSEISGLGSSHPDDSNTSHDDDDDDDVVKRALDEANEYVSQGDYDEALWILERLGQLDPSAKGVSELAAVAAVCSAALWRSCNCLPRETSRPDWYKILKVDAKSELSEIKKRYRHLALLLHPDKNKHVKAEAAFKLVSEAYACLSDKKKREIFDAKKAFVKCKHCNTKDCSSSGLDKWSNQHILSEKANLQKSGSSPDLSQSDWILDQERLKMFRARARARIFSNLEKSWKDRCVTALGKTNIVNDEFAKSMNSQMRMNSGYWHPKARARRPSHKKRENFTESSLAEEKDSKVGEINVEENKQDDTSYQLYQPFKNLGVLIRDLQAELVSSTEDEVHQQEEATCHKYAGERTGQREFMDLKTYSHDHNVVMTGFKVCSTQPSSVNDKGPHNHALSPGKEAFWTVYGNSPSLSPQGPTCADDFKHSVLHPAENDGTGSTNIISMKIFEKRDKRYKEARDSQGKDYFGITTQDINTGNVILKEQNFCPQPCRGESLDLEEEILRSQKEKSDQLLKTLQRLREETRTVAASLNHLCSGCGS
ncbi:hypothetical protein KP509_35G061300 [Ceratopteris richardii]|uniref:J domain-containing protein n=1 Tax=Ceratopteris richardii TaxID=49495 RepID=A0A8T2QHM5_CERRI|nr:hypothetical protein KP509_35G061300 [Ceratopteris richardii]